MCGISKKSFRKITDPLGIMPAKIQDKINDPLGLFPDDPKSTPAADTKEKPVVYMSNPWVDGLGIAGTNARGRNSLRIDPGIMRALINVQPPATAAPTTPTTPKTNIPATVPRTPRTKFGALTAKLVGRGLGIEA